MIHDAGGRGWQLSKGSRSKAQGTRHDLLVITHYKCVRYESRCSQNELPTFHGRGWFDPSHVNVKRSRPPTTPAPLPTPSLPTHPHPILIPPRLLLRLLQQILHRLIQIQLDRTLGQNLAVDIALARRLLVLLEPHQQHLVLRLPAHPARRHNVVGARAPAGGAAEVELRVC
ncbi:uncharacterized protein CC84DRAFT_379049 [Paraphaeosphaeria sporulosa]|uniref:Uncharacterized protein n=1 Tax=Paraphaeosphaeria sporulosa TaxID=1460663 RepID=A0A177BW42_9PLEO|nr:uncharacterized protein CC84DRAFT_379049 [Paraphaeosphaeria sporulosa]OAF99713.1 hypothetical protein CC84DRAFT_379049 [Paraphaeosphaeria sporulosa]